VTRRRRRVTVTVDSSSRPGGGRPESNSPPRRPGRGAAVTGFGPGNRTKRVEGAGEPPAGPQAAIRDCHSESNHCQPRMTFSTPFSVPFSKKELKKGLD
jgi:hypothetical protein